MKRYQFDLNGETIFKNVSLNNEQKFFDKYGKYNPVLISDEPGKSQGTGQSQNNQQNTTDLKSDNGSLDSQESNALTDMVDDFMGWFKKTKAGELLQKQGEKNTEILLGTKENPTALGEAIYSAIPSAQSIDETFTVALGKKFDDLTDKDFEAYVDVVNKANAAGELTELKEWTDAYDKYRKDENVFMSTLLATKDKGATGLAQVTVQSMARLFNKQSIAAGTAIGGVGTGLAGPAGAMGGFFAGANFMTESMLSFQGLLQDELTKQNLDFTADNIRTVLSDEKTRNKIQAKAIARGGVIGTVEGISTLLGAKGAFTVGQAVTKATGKGVAGRVVTATAQTGAAATAEAIGGGLGEAAGLTIEGKPLDEKEILLEAIAGLAKAPLDVAVSGGKAIINKPKYTIKGTEVGEAKFKSIIDNADDVDLALMDIDIQNDNEYAANVFKRQQKAYYNSVVDTKVTGEDRNTLVDLEIQRTEIKRKLKDQDTKSNQNALKDIETKIDDITNKYQDVDVTTEEVAAREEVKTKVLEQQADKNFEANMEFAKKHSKLYGLEVEDNLTQEEIRAKYGDELAESLGGVVENKIVINKDLAKKRVYGDNVANHELLHGIIKSSGQLGNISQKTINDFLNIIGKDNAAKIQKRIDDNYDAEYMARSKDEYFTIFSDLVENNKIKFNDSLFTQVKDVIRRFFADLGYANIDFETGRGAYNFLKDYNKSIHKGSLSKGVTRKAADVTFDEAKFSRDAKPVVDELGKMGWTAKTWKDQGANFAIKEMQENKTLDRLIASKLKVPMNVERTQEFVSKVYSELTPHAKNFNPEVNDSFFGWVNAQIANKAGNVFNREYKVEQRTQDIDARTEEGAPVIQVEADTTAEQEFIDRIGLTEEQQVQYSKLRRRLKLDDKMMNKVRQAVIKTFGTKLPDVESKQFRTELQKRFRTELKKPIQDMIGSRNNYDKFLQENFEAVFNALPVETLIQMERNLPAEQRIFTKSRRITKPTEVDKLISDGLLPKDTNRLSGPQLHTKKSFPGINKTMAFFRGVDMEAQLGYKVGASTLGTRKDKLAMEMGVELAFDATMETVQQPEIQEKRKDILELEGKVQARNEAAIIAKQIDRDPTVKFSKSVDEVLNIRDLFELETKGIDKLLAKYEISNTFDLKTEEGIEEFVESIKTQLLPLMPKDFWFGAGGGTVFTPSYYIVGSSDNPVLKQKYKDLYNKVLVPKIKQLRNLPDSSFGKPINGIENFSVSSYSTIFKDSKTIKSNKKEIEKWNQKVSTIHKEMWKRFNSAIVKDKNNARVIGNYLKMVGSDTKHWHKLGAQFVGYSKKITGTRFEYEHAMPATAAYLYLIDAALSESNFNTSYDLVINNYKLIALDKAMDKKLTSVKLQRRMPTGWSVIDNNWWDRYFNPDVASVKGGINPNSIIGIDGKTFAEMFNVNADGNPKLALPQSEINAVNNTKKALDNRMKYSKSGEAKGMSTFDFDETVGVSENFVIAKKGKETKRIASSEWPVVGEKLAEEGWQFDFSDFNKVTKGRPGPLFQKMKNQIKKYGPENVFILTARAPQSEKAIHDWLASNDINIPRKNVTGLGNSTGEAKAQWMLEKFAEGYNDMYFVDDAITNVKAVKNVLEQLDIKSKVVQAKIKFSKSASKDFNKMLERTKGIGADKIISRSAARKLGATKGRFEFFVPPSAEDLKGLIYRFLGKGKQGEADLQFFKDNLFDPFAKGIRAHDTYRQNMANEWAQLKKDNKDVVKSLNKKVKGSIYTNDTAVRVYLWDKNNFEIPGLSKEEQTQLVKHVNDSPELKAFADTLSIISRRPEGYIKPDENWVVQTTATDLNTIVNRVGRKEFLQEWVDNKNEIFSPENLNKIEAIYGTPVTDALNGMLHRMETGTNRTVGKDKNVNLFLDWINGSVGATMFFNMRSALLQTISTVNFINMSDNNLFKASAAFANQPQYWKDFSALFNSDMLKQRRRGLQTDVSASELTSTFAEGGTTSIDKIRAVIRYMLQKGFLPTQVADSFAIASGGATFYRNRINKYIKEGMSEAKAKEQAFLDFQEIAEETQQSSRPDLISEQQAGVLGRVILAWANTPMQYTRIVKKALSDIVNRRGDIRGNISKILYYGFIQNIIFGTLQTGLAFLLFGNDEDEDKIKDKTKIVFNGALDTILRGTGVYGAAVSTLKNTILKYREEKQKGFGKRDDLKIAQALVDLSPPIGSKLRKVTNAIKTQQYNKGVGEKLGFRIENPNLSIAANLIEAGTNIPVARLVNKANNMEEAITGQHDLWQRVALTSGWNRWNVGVEDEELEKARADVKREKQLKKKRQRLLDSKDKPTDRDGDGIKEYRCKAITSSGARCKNRTEHKSKKCYAHR